MIDETDPQDPVARAKQLRAAGVPLAEIERYLASKMTPVASGPITPGHSKFTAAQLERRATGTVTDAKAEEPTTTEKVTGGLSSLANSLPVIPSYARALVRGKGALSLPLGGVGGPVVPVPFADDLETASADIDDAQRSNPNVSRVGDVASNTLGLVASGAPKALISLGTGAARNAGTLARMAISPRRALVGILRDALAQEAPAAAQAVAPASHSILEGLLPIGADVGDAATPTAVRGVRAARPPLAPTLEQSMGTGATEAPSRLAAPVEDITDSPALRSRFNALRATPGSGDDLSVLRRAMQEAETAPTSTPSDAKGQLAQLLQSNLDEGMAAHAAAEESVPADNPELMQRIVESLKRAKAERLTPHPRFRPTGGESSGRSVADALRSQRP